MLTYSSGLFKLLRCIMLSGVCSVYILYSCCLGVFYHLMLCQWLIMKGETHTHTPNPAGISHLVVKSIWGFRRCLEIPRWRINPILVGLIFLWTMSVALISFVVSQPFLILSPLSLVVAFLGSFMFCVQGLGVVGRCLGHFATWR